jgi:hypothetical protein
MVILENWLAVAGAVSGFVYLFNELLHQTSNLQQGYADKATRCNYHNGWIDAEGKP